ncbi:SMP-30/gluconolactonase/LRE family protein [Pseudonocardia ailaonensis]|uniref:SMP-30/gluconolactonase/LRE family protein n=1 Tax=Pseudonocardia ailaonensis TaxID=367279 RepID=A0ABN2N6J9_9PSEU
MEILASGLQVPEGPIALEDGSIVLVEMKRGTLSRVWPDGAVSVVAELGGGPNGAAVGPDGAIYVCNNGGFEWGDVAGLTTPALQPEDYSGGRIERVTLDGDVTTLYTEVDGRKLNGPNDIVFDTAGGFWFTDLGKNRGREMDVGRICYAKADGSQIVEVVHPIMTPNGIGLSPDGSRLYVAETHAGRLWEWEVCGPGELGSLDGPSRGPVGASLLHGFGGYQMLDSLAVDGAGNVCVATLITGAISVIRPDGTLDRQIAVPGADPYVTNVCFGGDTAYVTSSGRGLLYRSDWPYPGLALVYGL